MRPRDALSPLIRNLPTLAGDGEVPWSCIELIDGLSLFVTAEAIDPAVWRAVTAELECPTWTTVSRSGALGYRATLVAPTGDAGLDIETIDRIAANAKTSDAWLGKNERAAIGRSGDPVLELACRWVLKEAYGKALGIGLALPLAALNFSGDGGVIIVTGAAAPLPNEGWRFGLFRNKDLLIGIAHRQYSSGNAVGPCRQKAANPAVG